MAFGCLIGPLVSGQSQGRGTRSSPGVAPSVGAQGRSVALTPQARLSSRGVMPSIEEDGSNERKPTFLGCAYTVVVVALIFGVPGYVMVTKAPPWPFLTALQLTVLPGGRYYPMFNLICICLAWWALIVAPIALFTVVYRRVRPSVKGPPET